MAINIKNNFGPVIHNEAGATINVNTAEAVERYEKAIKDGLLDSDDTPKKTRNRVTPEPQQATIVFDTYSINSNRGVTLAHFQYLGVLLANKGIIKECEGSNFIDLFEGQSNNCKIIWTGKYGKGGLKYLIDQLYRKGFIINSKHSIAESHFVDETGKYITNLKGSALSSTVKAMIDECMSAFDYFNPTDAIRKHNESLQEKEDIRVDKSELF